MDGEDIPLENVLVTGAVDTSAPGFYQVKYTVNYTNSKEKEQAVSFISSITEETAYAAEEGDNSLSAVATIQVVKKENSLISNTTTTEKVDENIVQSYITKSNDGKYHLTNKTTKTLPKTGENKQSILIPTLGMSAIVSAIYGFIVTKKRKKLN